MRVWERRLMRDFHVSPAMGGADDTGEASEQTNTKFKKLAKLAMKSRLADVVSECQGRPIS